MRSALAGAVVAAVAVWTGMTADGAGAVDYSTAPFKVTTNRYTYGQAPVFMPDGKHVAFGQDFNSSQDFNDGQYNQVYIADYPDGRHLQCLTCAGPDSATSNVNGVPAVRPQGDWILFHSWRGHTFTFLSPGYGGYGSDLWVMRPDGSRQTQLTSLVPPGAPPGREEGYDDYHAYWSPDGKHLVWAHFNGQFLYDNGLGKWDVRVADFVVRNGKPALANVRVVRPANGHWYETQWWAPDGSGFLYTETYGSASIPQLFYCRLPKTGPCQVTRLTDSPSWDEQALFTPDMKNVIFMSSRAQPGFFNTWANLAQALGLPTNYDNMLILPVFTAGFLEPVGQEHTDLYELNLATRAVRRLTTDGNDGWVTPEFGWDPKGKFLMWTENSFSGGYQYPFPPNAAQYMQSVKQLAQNPTAGDLVQRTRIGVFAPGA